MLRFLKHFLGLGRSFFHFVCGFSSVAFSYLSLDCAPSFFHRRGQWQHGLPAPSQDQGDRHQRSDSEAEILLYLQNLQTATCLPLQPLWQLCGYVKLCSDLMSLTWDLKGLFNNRSQNHHQLINTVFPFIFFCLPISPVVVFKGFHTHFSSINQFTNKLIERQ